MQHHSRFSCCADLPACSLVQYCQLLSGSRPSGGADTSWADDHKLLCYCRAAFVKAFCDQAGFNVSHDEVVKTTMDGITSEIRFMQFRSFV